ncbi:MAG: Ohr family peroxiredoxin [Opitutaceae bacterium]
MKTIQIGSMTTQGGRAGSVESPDDGFKVKFGKHGSAPTPEHLFAGAYAACFHSSLEAVAERAHKQIPGLAVTADCRLRNSNGDGSRLAIEIRAAMPGLKRNEAEHLLHLAHDACPYSRALRGDSQVTLSLD